MVCKQCRYQNGTDAKYCSGCGAALISTDLQQNDRPKSGQRKRMILNIAAGVAAAVIIFCNAILLSGNLAGKSVGISQILPMEDGSVAVLYTDGTVKVSGNSQFSEGVQDWSHVTKIYYNEVLDWRDGEFHDESYLAGLSEDGSVVTTDGELSDWRNVKELHFAWDRIVGVTGDGRILTDGTWEDETVRDILAGMSNVETLVYSSIQDIWGCLKKDGSVYLISGYTDPSEAYWDNVKELRDSGHAFYVIKNDGSVEGGLEDSYPGLNGAVKVVHYYDWIFGISEEGRLLTHNNGNIYTNTGAMMVDLPVSPYYGGEVDISQFNQLKDIVVYNGLILLNRDGTVDTIGDYPNWDLSDWSNIKQVCGTSDSDWENITLYGIKQDGSVIISRYNRDRMMQTVTDQYRGWKLQVIYTGNGGVVGLTTDGKLVGDGIYENVDFSVFDK